MERLGLFLFSVWGTQVFFGFVYLVIQFAFVILKFAWFSGEILREFIMNIFVLFYIWITITFVFLNFADLLKDCTWKDLCCKEEKEWEDLSCKEEKEWEENS